MEKGVAFDATLALVRTSKSIDYPLKCTLETIVSASMWPGVRVNSVAPSFSPLCPRCGQEPETSLHCFWTCPNNAACTEEAITSTKSLIEAATHGSVDIPCMWLRGILPSYLVEISTEHAPSDEVKVVYTNKPNTYTSGTYYGDGSGGEYSSFPSLRRCGRSIVQITSTGELSHAARFSLPGTIQTVPRAEFYCLVWLALQLEPCSDIHYITDNLGLHNTFNKGPKAGLVSSNADLYNILYKHAVEKAIQIKVSWMPSHLTPAEDRPQHVSELDLKGNAQADHQAGLMTKEVCLPLGVSAPVIYYYSLIKRIQRRLTTIVTHLPHRVRHKTAPMERRVKPSIESLIAVSDHIAFEQGARVKCARCLNSFHELDASLQHFLSSPCTAVGTNLDQPIPVSYEAIHIGRQVVHHTHKLFTYEDVRYCNRCGMLGASKLRNPAHPCSPPHLIWHEVTSRP